MGTLVYCHLYYWEMVSWRVWSCPCKGRGCGVCPCCCKTFIGAERMALVTVDSVPFQWEKLKCSRALVPGRSGDLCVVLTNTSLTLPEVRSVAKPCSSRLLNTPELLLSNADGEALKKGGELNRNNLHETCWRKHEVACCRIFTGKENQVFPTWGRKTFFFFPRESLLKRWF